MLVSQAGGLAMAVQAHHHLLPFSWSQLHIKVSGVPWMSSCARVHHCWGQHIFFWWAGVISWPCAANSSLSLGDFQPLWTEVCAPLFFKLSPSFLQHCYLLILHHWWLCQLTLLKATVAQLHYCNVSLSCPVLVLRTFLCQDLKECAGWPHTHTCTRTHNLHMHTHT